MASLQALFAPLEGDDDQLPRPSAPLLDEAAPSTTSVVTERSPPSLASVPNSDALSSRSVKGLRNSNSYGALQNLFVPLESEVPLQAGNKTPRSHHNTNRRNSDFTNDVGATVSPPPRYIPARQLQQLFSLDDISPLSARRSFGSFHSDSERSSPRQTISPDLSDIEPLSSGKTVAWQLKQIGTDCLGGAMGFLLVLVTVLCFALVTCCVPRMRENMPAVLQMLAFGTIIVGLSAGVSNIPYFLVAPDLFVCPFYVSIVRILDSAIPDEASEQLFPTFIVVVIIMVTFMGGLLVAAMKLRLLRLGEYTPFPVVEGLIASIGVSLARDCVLVQTDTINTAVANDLIWLAAAASIMVALFVLDHGFGVPLGVVYFPIFFAAVLLFYAVLWLVGEGDLGRGILWADAHHAFLQQSELSSTEEGAAFSVWTSGALSNQVDWAAAAKCTGVVLSFWVIELLKLTVHYPQALKMVGSKMSDAKLESEISLVGWATVAAGVLGSFSAIPAIAPMAMISETFTGEVTPRKKSPNIVCTACVTAIFFWGFAIVRVIPKFVFSAMLMHTAGTVLWNRFVLSIQKIAWNEGLVIVVIVAVSVVTGSTMNAIAVGAVCSVLLFVYQWHALGCIKYASSGLMWRSSVERPEADVEWLERHGDAIQILQLQGFIFFGNAEMVLKRVETMLNEDTAIQEENTLQGSSPPSRSMLLRQSSLGADPLCFVLIDMTLVMGLDHSAIVVLEETVAAVAQHSTRNHNKPLVIALTGASDDAWSRIRHSGLPFLNDETVTRRFDDLDAGLSWCEDDLLSRLAGAQSLSLSSSVAPSIRSHDLESFDVWVKICAERFNIDTAPLAELAAFTRETKWKKGDILLRQQHGSRIGGSGEGIRFITHGLISKKRDPAQSLTTISKNRMLKLDRQALQGNMREFRFARFGPGGVVGLDDFFTGFRSVGVFEAETDVVAHFLPYAVIEKLEKERPELIMHLLRILGRLLASQFNRTKERLSHVMDAMTTVNTRKDNENLPSRRTMRLVRNLAGRMSA